MISDVLCEAESDIRFLQEYSPQSYDTVVKEVEVVLTVMRTFVRHQAYPPIPHRRLPDYLDKRKLIIESVRSLDVSEIETSTRDLMEHQHSPKQVGIRRSAGKRSRPFKNSDFHKVAIVLGRVIKEIRSYQKPPFANGYSGVRKEIDILVKVITALRLYLDALAQPIPKHEAKLKMLSESLRRLDVVECQRSMKEMYDYLGLDSLDRDRLHVHEWIVYGTSEHEGWLWVQCIDCGEIGTIEDASPQDWSDAMYASSRPYRWHDNSRITERGYADPRVIRADHGAPSECSSEGSVSDNKGYERVLGSV